MTVITCPECGADQSGSYPFTIVDITTPEDRQLKQLRLALRCESCGFATSFTAKKEPSHD